MKALNMFSRMLIPLLVSFIVCSSSAESAVLPDEEVQALKDFGDTLGKYWNFSVDPCSGNYGWATPPLNSSDNAVVCNCTFSNNTLCHVVSIYLKSQNLQGTLPRDLSGFPYLGVLDLTRNYLNGTIPPQWGLSNLVKVSLLGNRLTGPIPKEIANISTLTEWVVENNMLSGPLPSELGSMPSIERLLLTSNYLSGELPTTLGGLTTLKDFRIGDNNFEGKIPSFIQNWVNLDKIAIQGSGLDGPIPPEISALVKLTDMRISDLNGTESAFPPLKDMTKLKTLVLRSCNMIGDIPEYIGSITTLKLIDLSFNKLSGKIPSTFSGLQDADFIYLTGNLLTGQVPEWILTKGDNIDLSYNKFTIDGECQVRSVNLFESSSNGSKSGIAPCLKSAQCPKTRYSMNINCGGKQIDDNGTTYEDDTNSAGASNFFRSNGANWAFSSTGNFLDDSSSSDSYIQTNMSRLYMDNYELYTNARVSPLSLTYYGFCLGNGNYTVNLHFAETKFSDDKTYSSLGRRKFDIYVQRELKLKDFDIAYEAGGVGRAIRRNFTIAVTNNTLEIRLYWAGKGTISLPERGVYGPLISAISAVDPDHPDDTQLPSESSSISVGAVVGIVAGVVVIIFVVLSILWWKGCIGRKNTMDNDLKGLDLQTGSFTLRQIKAATNNFDAANKIGEGGFGPVYKGLLSDGKVIAVKQLSSKSKQGNREFVNEIGMISALQHPHLVKLYGCCIEGNQLLLVYEYMENNSLARALFGPEECQLKLDWPTRHKICIGIARGLAYLHEESRLKIVHRDIKATNVLLDKNLDPKISDFGLAKLDEEDNTHISTRIAGTFGYMAPEYAMRGYLTDKADVYSFGIVALEIVSGKSNTLYRTKEECFYLLDWAQQLKDKDSLMELVDTRLASEFNKEEVVAMIHVALMCSDPSPTARPSMSAVVSMLEGKMVVQEPVSDPSISKQDRKAKVLKNHHEQRDEQNISDVQQHSTSTDGPWTASSTSAPDLYPVNLDSDYWRNRE